MIITLARYRIDSITATYNLTNNYICVAMRSNFLIYICIYIYIYQLSCVTGSSVTLFRDRRYANIFEVSAIRPDNPRHRLPGENER